MLRRAASIVAREAYGVSGVYGGRGGISVVAPTTTSISTMTRWTSSATAALTTRGLAPAVRFHGASRFLSLYAGRNGSYSYCPSRNPGARRTALRALMSTDAGDKTKKSANKGGGEKGDGDDEDTKEIVLTPGEKVVVASRLTMWFGVAVFAGFCAYFIGKELIPTKMSPNRVFDRSYDLVKNDPEVRRRYGEALKAYGRDHGGHREGRRNFVEHTEYVNQDDGSKRTRVRYNLSGQFGTAFVFAEVSNQMPSGEFVYVLVQDKSNGRVHTCVDNRAAMTAARLAAGNKEAQSAMSQLLSGGGGQK